MRLTEFLIKSTKLNEIPKPGFKSQLKMEPHGREMCHTKKNNLRFAATMLLFYPIKKVLYFVLQGLLKKTFIQTKLLFQEDK